MLPPDPILPSSSHRADWRPGLFVAGLLLLLAPSLYANPYFGFHRRLWVWDVWRESLSWDERTELFGISLTAVCAVLAGVGVGRIRLLSVVAVLGALFAIRLHGEAATFSLLAVDRLGLTWFASGLVLCVGLLTLSRRDGSKRSVGIGLTIVGAVWILTFLVAWFPQDPAAQGRSMISYYIVRVPRYWDAIVLQGEIDPAARRALIPLLWAQVAPTIMLGASLVLGVFAAVRARARGAGRASARVAFAAYLCTWLVPLASALINDFDDPLKSGASRAAGTIGNALLDAGMALWLVLALTLSAIVSEGAMGRRAALPAIAPPDPARAARFPFAVASAATVASLIAHFNPEHGIAARGWPTQALAHFEWDIAGATLTFHGILLALALVGLFTPARRGDGWILGLGFGAALIALEGPIRDDHEIRQFLYRAPAYAPFVLAALAAGGRAGASQGDRTRSMISRASGFILLALLVYPMSVWTPTAAIPTRQVVDSYSSVLAIGWTWPDTAAEYFFGFERKFGSPFTTTLLAALGVVACVPTRGTGRRAGAVAAWTLFAAASVWPIIQIVVGSALDAATHGIDPPSDLAFRSVAAIAFFFLAVAWAVAGWAARVPVGPSDVRSSTPSA